jgi:hypothetical protein
LFEHLVQYLFISERIDRVHSRSFSRRIDPEDKADGGRDADAEKNGGEGERESPSELIELAEE